MANLDSAVTIELKGCLVSSSNPKPEGASPHDADFGVGSGPVDRLRPLHDEMTAWRRDFHAHPETAFEEHRTSDRIAGLLAGWGIEVHRGLGGTGVVGSLTVGAGRCIGLRADMDALHLHEATGLDHQSRHPGRMHACGHDGHCAMLLGAARHLAGTRRFRGTVRFVFQPAEENEAGARRMIEDGLFARFPVDAVYGMHNWPDAPEGAVGLRTGPVMASFDVFEAVVVGCGAHAAMPHLGIDPIPIAAQIVAAWQGVVARGVDPLDSAVVSVTQIHAGDTWNVIPDRATLRGTARTFRPQVRDRLESRLRALGTAICEGAGASMEWCYERRYPATVNHARETELARRVAEAVVGAGQVIPDMPPSMGSEDFAFMLQRVPGCYLRLGTGDAGGRGLHSPRYDFNDRVLPIGAALWVALAESELAAAD